MSHQWVQSVITHDHSNTVTSNFNYKHSTEYYAQLHMANLELKELISVDCWQILTYVNQFYLNKSTHFNNSNNIYTKPNIFQFVNKWPSQHQNTSGFVSNFLLLKCVFLMEIILINMKCSVNTNTYKTCHVFCCCLFPLWPDSCLFISPNEISCLFRTSLGTFVCQNYTCSFTQNDLLRSECHNKQLQNHTFVRI